AMRIIGERKNASVAQIAVAWAIAKKTLPIIGVTKAAQVEEMLKASAIELSQDEMNTIETLARNAGVDTKGSWEESMV
ncbi:aldo/keto reductase, partial [Chryseobacterium sp. VD8]